MTTFTVTGTLTGAPYEGFALRLLVLTGVSEMGGASGSADAYRIGELSITPDSNGSLIILGLQAGGRTVTFIPAASNTFIDSSVNVYNDTEATGYYSGAVTSGVPVTVGSSAPSGDFTTIAAYELQPAGTPAIDYSSPYRLATGQYPNAAAITTAPFTPPAGAVLAAIILFNTAGASTLAVTDTSGLGMTWTQQINSGNIPYSGGAAIFTATVPPAGGNNTSPAYATNYSVLGGGTGSWVNPDNAEGPPEGSFATWMAP